jgi:hypothetical protein
MTPVTRGLVAGGVVVLVLVVATSVTSSWWNRHAPALVAASQAALAAGRHFGQTASAAQCVDEVLRQRAATPRTSAATLAQRSFLQGCIVVSPTGTALCPRAAADGPVPDARWLVELCEARRADRGCPDVLRPLAQFCIGRSPS